MLEGPLVFVDIDTQRDFMEPTGALFVPGSPLIAENLARLTEFARTRAIPVIASACCHWPDDLELERFPPHCMEGTPGQQRIPATAWPDGTVLAADAHLEGEVPGHLTLEKHAMDLFSHPDAERLFDVYNRNHPTFVVYGVTTEYCVMCAASGLLDRRYRIAVVVDAVRALNPQYESSVLSGLALRGALLTLTEVVCEDAEHAR